MQLITLAVPYEEREAVKSLGATWDTTFKRWYITDNMKLSLFTKWLPSAGTCNVSIPDELLLLAAQQACWQCEQTTMVYCLATRKLKDESQARTKTGFFTLHHLRALPPALNALLLEKSITYSFDHSAKRKENYWLNHCQCGAKIEDMLLHQRRGNAFSPRDEGHSVSYTHLTLPTIYSV